MAYVGSLASAADRQPSPVTLNLSSNNPFRNRNTISPTPRSPDALPLDKGAMAPTNPFLDHVDVAPAPRAPRSNIPNNSNNNNAGVLPEDIFSDLSLLDKPNLSGPAPAPMQGGRPMNSDERRDRPRGPPRPSASPAKRDARPRRASESSVMDRDRSGRPREDRDRSDRPPRTESEERRRRERRREREERHRREKEKDKSRKPARRPQGLDIIDKLDVTGVYGQGLFHHDGPFDACNPHRNAKKSRHAPMQAFPADSANMALGGSGPLRNRIDLDKFHGRGEEGFSEFAATRKPATTVVDPTDRVDQVHGPETNGLGTSTFLEGAPASKSALQRRDSDEPGEAGAAGGGLSRKKSLAQRFRGMSNARRYDTTSPEARYHQQRPSGDAEYSPPRAKATSAGGPVRARYNKENEVNPFDNDYEAAFEQKGAQIRIAEQEQLSTPGRPRAPSSPGRGAALQRARTADADGSMWRGSSNEEERPSGGGGFLNRMKSLKGGRRARNDA